MDQIRDQKEEVREKNRVKARNRRAKFTEKLREYDRMRYARDHEIVRSRRAKQYAENSGGMREKALAYAQHRYRAGKMEFRLRAALAAAKARCAKRGIDFDIVLADLGEPTCCAVTGVEFDLTSSFRQGNTFVPSLDRIDPNKGYVKGNVRIVVHAYNLAKHTGSDSQVLKLARALVAKFGMTDI
jgi:hypothetical protein